VMSTFRKGDMVSIQATVAIDHNEAFGLLHLDLQGGGKIAVNPNHATLVAQAIEPGDLVEVKLSTRISVATVIAVYAEREMAWLDLGDEGTVQQPFAALRRLDRPQEIAEAA
jgi:hypothetical protein